MRDLRPNRWHMRYNLDGKIVPGGRDNFGPPDCCTTSTTTTTAIPGCNGYSGSITVGDLPIGEFFPNGIGYIEAVGIDVGSASPSPIIIPEGTVAAIVCVYIEYTWILGILSLDPGGAMFSIYEIIIDGISYPMTPEGSVCFVPNNIFVTGQTYNICINYNDITTTTTTTII